MTRRSRYEPVTPTPERRAADQPTLWLAARARNALRRPALAAAVGVPVFVVSLVALLLAPREARRAAELVAPRPEDRPDTLALVTRVEQAGARAARADTALAEARLLATAPPAPVGIDTLSPQVIARRDSISAIIGELSQGLARVEASPLAASYRALGELPSLQAEPRVRLLLDSLAAIDRERESFGAVGGIDPTFIALTARATTIGRAIQEIAQAKRDALRATLAAMTAPPKPAPRPMIDTAAFLARRDSAQRSFAAARVTLERARVALADYERREERARQLANLGAPPLAMLGAALVLGLVFGYAASLGAELRRPLLADAREAERVTGVRVLAEVTELLPSPERGRRRADREAPPLVEAWSDTYRLLYLDVASAGAPVVMTTVTGDHPEIAATVAANFAALASLEARTTLLVDADLTASAVAGVARVAQEPGLTKIMRGESGWADVTRSFVVGRDYVVNVVPAGRPERAPRWEDVTDLLASDIARLARRYDAIVLVAAPEEAMSGLVRVLPITDCIYCAQIGVTPVSTLTAAVEGLRNAGATVRGLVLWNRDEPHVPTGEELDAALREGMLTTDTFRVPVGG